MSAAAAGPSAELQSLMDAVAPLPHPSEVAELAHLLDITANFRDNHQRARYLLSSNWGRFWMSA